MLASRFLASSCSHTLSTRQPLAFKTRFTLRNTRGIDIVATNKDAKRTVTIQCKTSQRERKSWLLGAKGEDFYAPAHFYVFVDLHGERERPEPTHFADYADHCKRPTEDLLDGS